MEEMRAHGPHNASLSKRPTLLTERARFWSYFSLELPPLYVYLAGGGDAHARAVIGPCIYPSACSNE